MKICRAPGCTTRLYRGNTSGVCREHNHLEGSCRCAQCLKIPGDRGLTAEPRRAAETPAPAPVPAPTTPAPDAALDAWPDPDAPLAQWARPLSATIPRMTR